MSEIYEHQLFVDDPEIPEVMDMETGEYLTLAQVVGLDEPRAVRLRMAIKEGPLRNMPLYVCPSGGSGKR